MANESLSYYLSRASFLLVHVVFAYWLLWITNDPLNTGLVNTIDSKAAIAGSVEAPCVAFDRDAFLYNLAVFLLLWWLPHSGLARKRVKKLIGTWNTNLDRPIFATLACVGWGATLLLWRPVSTCSPAFNVLNISPIAAVVAGSVITVGLIQVLGLFYLLPSHVFGTDRWQYNEKNPMPHSDIIANFPYNLTRHPAASTFLWIYSTLVLLSSFNVNFVVLSSFWIVFIVVGTLIFEEGGLRGPDEFGVAYEKYANKVNAFVPSAWSIKKALGLIKVRDDEFAIKNNNKSVQKSSKSKSKNKAA